MRLIASHTTAACEYLVDWTLVSASQGREVVLLVFLTQTLVTIKIVKSCAEDASFTWGVGVALAALVLTIRSIIELMRLAIFTKNSIKIFALWAHIHADRVFVFLVEATDA